MNRILTKEFNEAWNKLNEQIELDEAKKELCLISDRAKDFKKVEATILTPEYFAHKNNYSGWVITDRASGLALKFGFRTLADAKNYLQTMPEEELEKINEIKATLQYKEQCAKLAAANIDNYELDEDFCYSVFEALEEDEQESLFEGKPNNPQKRLSTYRGLNSFDKTDFITDESFPTLLDLVKADSIFLSTSKKPISVDEAKNRSIASIFAMLDKNKCEKYGIDQEEVIVDGHNIIQLCEANGCSIKEVIKNHLGQIGRTKTNEPAKLKNFRGFDNDGLIGLDSQLPTLWQFIIHDAEAENIKEYSVANLKKPVRKVLLDLNAFTEQNGFTEEEILRIKNAANSPQRVGKIYQWCYEKKSSVLNYFKEVFGKLEFYKLKDREDKLLNVKAELSDENFEDRELNELDTKKLKDYLKGIGTEYELKDLSQIVSIPDKLNLADLPHSSPIRLKWKCETHGPYLQSLYNHLAGAGCPSCALRRQESKAEKILTTALEQQLDQEKFTVIQGDKITKSVLQFKNLGTDKLLGLDIIIKSNITKNIVAAVEYDGSPWHSISYTIENDMKKDALSMEKNIHLFRIREKESLEEITKALSYFNLIPAQQEYMNNYPDKITVFTRPAKELTIDEANEYAAIISQYLNNNNIEEADVISL